MITIKNDTNCSVKNLGNMAWKTGGVILRVDPLRLGEEIAHMAAEEIVGTDSVLEIRMCRIFKLKGEDYLNPDKSHFSKRVGNFSLDLNEMFSFEYLSKELNPGVNPLLY